MGATSSIEWTDATWNPLLAKRRDNEKVGFHCVKVGSECSNCYAESINLRNLPHSGNGLPYTKDSGEKVEILLSEKKMLQPIQWRKPRKIFVCSMTDLFGEFVPFNLIDEVFRVIQTRPDHTFQILTKRPELALEYCNQRDTRMPDNVWMGATAGRFDVARRRLPYLAQIPARVRYVSAEPLLGPVDFSFLWRPDKCPIHWLIAGGESGRRARMSHPNWFRQVRDYCDKSHIPFFFKQWGTWWPSSQGCGGDEEEAKASRAVMDPNGNVITGNRRKLPEGTETFLRVGKQAAGRILDGVVHEAFPELAA